MALDTQDPFTLPIDGHASIAAAIREQAAAATADAPSDSVPAQPEQCEPSAEDLLAHSRPKRLTIAGLSVQLGSAVARIAALETEVQQLRQSKPAAAPRSVPASGMQLHVPVIAAPFQKGKCEAHGQVGATKTGQCPTCLNAARRAAAGVPAQA
jgi:hypothetical protein